MRGAARLGRNLGARAAFPDNKRVSDNESNIIKQGAFFASNSTVLTNVVKKEIDSFVTDLRGDSDGAASLIFVVTGHTENVADQRFNHALAKLRAENTANYLTTNKKIDPARMSVISYGETVPVGRKCDGSRRAKNRRVEILVYKDTVSIAFGGAVKGTN